MKRTEKMYGPQMKNKYTSNGFRSVTTESMNKAAEIFASRAARKHYGRSGYCRTCNQGSYTQDGRLSEYSAFIGYSTSGNPHETTGHNINFTVFSADTQALSESHGAV